MAATFIDYSIAIGLMLVSFTTIISFATNFSSGALADMRLSTLHAQAASLIGLLDREYAFGTSISGIGLAKAVVNTSVDPPEQTIVVSSVALQLIASKQYRAIREDFDFRMRIFDSSNATAFSYGATPPLTTVIAIRKPVMYETAVGIKRGTFVVEVW